MRSEPRVPESVLDRVRAPFLVGKPERIDPAVIQPLNLLLDLSGEAMRERLFVVQGEKGAEACLRPDFTIPVARSYVVEAVGDALERQYYYQGQAFRMPPASGGEDHPSEFLQIGMESFGGGGENAESQMAGLAWKSAMAGGRTDLSLRIGDVGLFAAFLEDIGTPEIIATRLRRAFTRPQRLKAELARATTRNPDAGRIAAALAGQATRRAAEAIEQRWADEGLEPVGGRTAIEIADRLIALTHEASAPCLARAQVEHIQTYLSLVGDPGAVRAAVRDLVRGDATEQKMGASGFMLDALVKAGVPADRIRFDASFGGPFTYYDGFVFEITSAALGDGLTVAAGGRYDALLAQLSGKASRAVGCMVRPYRAWNGALS